MPVASVSPPRLWVKHAEWLITPIAILLNVGYTVVNLIVVLRGDVPNPAHLNSVTLALTLVNAVLQASILLWRNRRPEIVFLVGTGLYVVGLLLTRADLVYLMPSYFFLVAVFSSRPPQRKQFLLLACAMLVILIGCVANVGLHYTELAPQQYGQFVVLTGLKAFFAFMVMFAVGSWYGAIRRQSTLRQSNAELIESEQEARLQTALVMERNHMARELHDVAAHHLTTIMVQSKALRRMQDLNTQETRDLLDIVASESEHAVRNMNVIVGVLRQHRETGELPQLSKLPVLLTSFANNEEDVRVEVLGDLETVGPQASLTGYRIVQEGVTNARKHAPGSTIRVRIERSLRQLTAEITNGPSPAGTDPTVTPGGYGIIGMQERVLLLGGTLRSGACPDGGWFISATIPINVERNTL